MNLLEPNNTSNNKLYTNIEKHIKDNSFKINNTSMNKEDLKIRKKILNRIKNSSPILQLKIINSNSNFEKGTKLIINCQGLKNGINNRKDGYTYFGYYPYNMSIPLDDDGNKMIDCNLSSKKNNNVNINDENINNLGRHFVIEYNIEKSKYIIKDLGIGYGTFVRLNYIHTLKDNQLINIGQIFILVYISEKGENFFTNTIGDSKGNISQINNNNNNNSIISSKGNVLKLKIYGVNNNGDTFYFMPQKRNISIGRYELADIQLNDKLLSQIHCMINYKEDEGWKLIDGQQNKPSTNGTWIYINDQYQIYDKMIFKTNQNIFQANIFKSEKEITE